MLSFVGLFRGLGIMFLLLVPLVVLMRTFDVTPDGQRIVFDRLRENSDIVLIDLPSASR